MSAHPSGCNRIATEEAYGPPELFTEYERLLEMGSGDRGFRSLWGYYLGNPSPHTEEFRARIADLSELRLSDMDALGISRQIVSLTTPGVELLDLARARDIAQIANERISDACRKHPSRFSGLAAVALQDIDFSVDELKRSVEKLGLRGLIVNSHSRGDYLDHPRFEPLWATAAELGVPLYLHPNTPSEPMIGPMLESGLDGAIYGFGVETGMHLIRIIFSGVFDRYPTLKVVVGHLGEALPFWLFRVDHFHALQARTGRYPWRPTLGHKPSHYLRENIWLTTSGMAWAPAIMFAREVVGASRVMYAMDYPFQASAEEVAVQDALALSPSELSSFYEGIATRVFGLA